MKLNFKNLTALFKEYKKLQSVLPKTDLFFVGGAVRDLLIERTKKPKDIDCACAGTPETIRSQIENNADESLSRFKTEKFGTMSLIDKNENTQNNDTEIEITPFRTEGVYTDLRHPDELDRSDNLWKDSKRRDFSINALYWIGYNNSWSTSSEETVNEYFQAKKAYKKRPILINETLIVDSKESIKKLTKGGSLNNNYLKKLLDKAVIIMETPKSKEPKDNAKTNNKIKTLKKGKKLSILIDPHKGIRDLYNGVIQTVGKADKRFQEDALRIIRGLRFVIMLNSSLNQGERGFDIRKKTWRAMQKHAELVKEVSIERISQELRKIFQGNNPYGYVALIQELGLLGHIFPAVATCMGNHQPSRHHGFDTYSHTLLTLHALQQKAEADEAMKLAMLYHDTGKPEQYAFIQKAIKENPEDPDRSGYEHHSEISVRHARQDLKRLCYPKEIIETVCWYIKRHHRPGEILEGSEKNIDKRLRKLISDGGYEQTKNLMTIAMADREGQLNPIQPPAIQELVELQERVDELYELEGRFTQQDLVIDGNRVMKEFDMEPGPALGEVLEKTFERVLTDHQSRNKENKIHNFIKSIL